MNDLTPDLAGRFADIALGHVSREYPFALVHVMNRPGDIAPAREQHPIFHGSFDWHSCVHGHWLLARILRLWPEIPQTDAIRAHFDQADYR